MPSDDPMIYTMQMTMSAGTDAKWVLFEAWRVKTGGQLFLAMLFIFALSFFIEGMSYGMFLVQRNINKVEGKSKNVPQQLINTVLYFLLRLLNYAQMLIVMTYNIWLILTMAVSVAFSNFVFNAIKDRLIISDAYKGKISPQ